MTQDFEIRTDNRITTAGKGGVRPKSAWELHDWVEKAKVKSEPITYAIMDSGIHQDAMNNHPWFKTAKVRERFDATGTENQGDAVGHGTGVASIIAANAGVKMKSQSEVGIPVDFYDVRIFGESGRTGTKTIAEAYKFLLDHAEEIDIVNMSWGASQDVPFINAMHDKLISKGVYDVTSAGNTGTDGGSPATAKRAFSAGAVDIEGDPTRFTSFDPDKGNPDVAAIGKDVVMARAPGTAMGVPLDEEFTKASGTSFSSPYTSAAYGIALMNQQVSWDQRFMDSAPDIPGTKADGGGLLKLKSAIEGETIIPSTDANIAKFFGYKFIDGDEGWIPTGRRSIKKVDEDEGSVTLRFE